MKELQYKKYTTNTLQDLHCELHYKYYSTQFALQVSYYSYTTIITLQYINHTTRTTLYYIYIIIIMQELHYTTIALQEL